MKHFLVLLFSAATVFGETVRLGDLNFHSAKQGWGKLQFNQSLDGKPLTIAGKTFAYGHGTDAASEIVYQLNGDYDGRFEVWVGVDDAMNGRPHGSVIFQVFGDGQELFHSGVMRVSEAAKRVSVDMAGVCELKLVVTDADEGKECDYVDWAEPILTGMNPL
jgi:alpha-galactosidase